MKITIILYYELREFFVSIASSFRDLGYDVDYFPLFRYCYDANDKRDDYKEFMSDFLKKNNSDYILWWFIDVPLDVFNFIKQNNHQKIIIYNCDDPLNFGPNNIEKFKKTTLIASNCNQYIKTYKSYCGVLNTHFMPMGYDPEYFFPQTFENNEIDEEFSCDISFVCDILYPKEHYPNQLFERKYILDEVSKYSINNGKIFNIYGPPFLKDLYPTHYKGGIEYINQSKLFNFSKINISTHANCSVDLPVNEYIMKILGSGGLLLTDKFGDSLDMFKDKCLFLEDDFISQIDNILNNYDDYKHIKNNGYELSKSFTWMKWASKIHINIIKQIFDPEIYKKFYSLDLEGEDLWNHWIDNPKNICYNIPIPSNFNVESYKEDFNIESDDSLVVYFHWMQHNKSNIYFSKKRDGDSSLAIDVNKSKLISEDLFYLFHILNGVKDVGNRNRALKELSSFVDNHPYLDFNNLLKTYFDIVDN